MAKTINMECPICKKKVLFVGVHDDEGNYHGLVGCEYENDPWSGLSYALHHEGWGDCPMCTDGAYSTMGGMLFDTAEDAISALSLPNEPLTIEQLREMKDEPAYLKVFDPLLKSGWHIIKAVTKDKIIFRGWQTVYVPIDGMGVNYNLYRCPPEGEA